MIRRTFLLGCVAVASIWMMLYGAVASATEPGPAAMVVSEDGSVLAVASTRSDVPKAIGDAVVTAKGQRITIEYLYRPHGTVQTPPNDPLFGQQWNFNAVGVSAAWDQSDGVGVVVAVLDAAVNFDGNDGFCGPVVSPYDAVVGFPGFAPLSQAPFGHGTHVAGTVNQCTNDGVGVTGIAPAASLMPVRVLSDLGVGTSSQLADGIDWAVDHGADVINLSLGGECTASWPTCNDSVVDASIARAQSAGVMIVASAGNAGAPFMAYPAAHPYAVAVGAIDSSNAVWSDGSGSGSNTGEALDVMAPGVAVLQEATGSGEYGYYLGTGTSMAAPHVSGAAVLMLGVNPDLTPDETAEIIRSTASDLGAPGRDSETGWGRVEVGAAVSEAASRYMPPAEPCQIGPCDTVVRVDAFGNWGVLDELTASPSVSEFFFGNPGDVPFMGDWDGDGVGTPGLYRQGDGFVYVRFTNTQGPANTEFFFGDPGDFPLVGDFDGDGSDSVSIWRAGEARVYVINELGVDGKGLGAADFSFGFGNPGDVPFVGDFDGDGVDTVGLYRQSTGFVYFRNSLTTGTADLSFFYGDPGDHIMAGDWDGDGDDTVGVYRPSTGRVYMNLENTNGAADWTGYVGTYPNVLKAGKR